MYAASFSEFIRVVLIILLVYFGIKILFRWFGPIILKFVLKKIGKKFNEKFNQYENPKNSQKEGDVSIEKKPKNQRKSNNSVGEYIDYEEID